MEKKAFVILDYLEKHKLTQTEFCRICGIGRFTLYNHIRGKYPIRPFTAHKIEDATRGAIKASDLLN